MSEFVRGFSGRDPLDTQTTERLLEQYQLEGVERDMFRSWMTEARMSGGKTLRAAWTFAEKAAEDESMIDRIRTGAGYSTLEEARVERKMALANSVPTPRRIVPNGAGGWTSEPIVPEHSVEGITAASFGVVPSEAEHERNERRERELREGDEERAASRQRELDRQPPPSPPRGWFASGK